MIGDLLRYFFVGLVALLGACAVLFVIALVLVGLYYCPSIIYGPVLLILLCIGLGKLIEELW